MFFSLHIIVGLGAMLLCIYNIGKVIQASSWIRTEATIVKPAHIQTLDDSDGDTYRIGLSYAYNINGQAFENNDFAISHFGFSSEQLENYSAISKKIKYAKRFDIWVNPNKPQESVVVKGMNNTILFFIIFSLCWNTLLAGFLVPSLFSDDNNELFKLNEEKNK